MTEQVPLQGICVHLPFLSKKSGPSFVKTTSIHHMFILESLLECTGHTDGMISCACEDDARWTDRTHASSATCMVEVSLMQVNLPDAYIGAFWQGKRGRTPQQPRPYGTSKLANLSLCFPTQQANSPHRTKVPVHKACLA